MGRIIVAGSINMDVSVRVQQQPQPGETVFGSELLFTPGGKGSNQAVAASRLMDECGTVALLGKVGEDAFGRELRAFLQRERLSLTGVRVSPDRPSGSALISVDAAGENQIIVVSGSNAELRAEEVSDAKLAPGDIAVAVFEIPQETIVAFFRRARECGARTLLNPAPYADFHPDLPALCDVLLLNEVELAALAGRPVAPKYEERCLEVMRAARQSADQTLIVTLGAAGALATTSAGAWRVPGLAVAAVDTTGAGDCFVGAFAVAHARGEALPAALAYANAAAAQSVTRVGASAAMPSGEEMAALSWPAAEQIPTR